MVRLADADALNGLKFADFARQLERELGEARELTSEINSSQQSWIAKCAAEITAHEATRAQLATIYAEAKP